MISARRQFLDSFLGALGAAEIVECLERATEIRGTLRFAEDSEVLDLSGDEGELQDFAWAVREEEAPSLLAYRIAEALRQFELLHLNKLRVPRRTLLEIVRENAEGAVGDGEFEAAFEELLAINVSMVESGKETEDAFFIQE